MSSQHRNNLTDTANETQERVLSASGYSLSLLIAAQTGAMWGHCYENAYPVFFACPALFDPHGLFIEGWIVFEDTSNRVVLMEHGWLLSSNRRIIDPTIVITVEPDQPVYYFSGVFRGRTELEALENEFFPHVHFDGYGNDGMGHTGYRMAYEAALQKARMLLTEGKTFVEVRATMLSQQEEEAVSNAHMLFLLLEKPGEEV